MSINNWTKLTELEATHQHDGNCIIAAFPKNFNIDKVYENFNRIKNRFPYQYSGGRYYPTPAILEISTNNKKDSEPQFCAFAESKYLPLDEIEETGPQAELASQLKKHYGDIFMGAWSDDCNFAFLTL